MINDGASRSMAALRASGLSAFAGVRTYWVTSALIAVTAIAALIAVLPVSAIFDWAHGGIATRLIAPPFPGGDLGLAWTMGVHPASEMQQEGVAALAEMLLATTAATLAVAAVTILTFSLMREAQRESELAVRRAVGASHRVVLGAAVLEALLLTMGGPGGGALAGLAVAGAAHAAWPGSIQAGTPAMSAVAIVALGAVILIGASFPVVLPRRRIAELEPHAPVPLTPAALQLGVSLIALTTAALLVRHAGHIARSDTQAGGTGRVTPIALSGSPAERARFYQRLLAAVEPLTGVKGASLTSPGVLLGVGPAGTVTTDCGNCSEGGLPLRWKVKPATHQFVSADTFRLLGTRVIAGRGITQADQWDTRRVAVVSRSLAAREFQNGEAIGRAIRVVNDGAEWATVVGIVDDPAPVGLGGAVQPRYAVYLSVLQYPPSSAELLVRGAADAGITRTLDDVVSPNRGEGMAKPSWRSESAVVAANAAPLTWFARWFGVEGWTMLVISLVGIFALMRLWVQSFLGELGIRRAVGARRRHVLSLIFRHAARVGVAGIAAGLVFGPATWGMLPTVLTGIESWDTGLILRFAAVLLASSLAGALLPAWSASRAAPAMLIASQWR